MRRQYLLRAAAARRPQQGWQLEKTRLEKTRVLLLGFIGFFQDNLEKTRENWVFSRFCILRCKIIAFFHKKLGFFMQNSIFSLRIATKNSKIHIQVCICNLSLILFPKTVLFLFMMSRLYLFQYYYFLKNVKIGKMLVAHNDILKKPKS